MKRLFLSKTVSHPLVNRLLPGFVRKNESGQAVILLALGFVALLAFVGIVTDVSLMFVRYSTLSRAVDAAAIASAGQMRSDRTFGEVGLAARQFIEFHGLDPVEVHVETCETTPSDVGLCPPDQRKLVRVTATIISPTIFMRLLGFGNIQLTAVAVSETAVLDVVIMMDVSESMLFDTTYSEWAKIGYGRVYVPPRFGGNYEPTIGDAIVTGSNPPAGNDKPDPADTVTFAPQEAGTIFQKEFTDQIKGTDTQAETIPNRTNWMPKALSTDSYLLPMYDDLLVNSTQEIISDRLSYSVGTNAPTADKDYAVGVYNFPGTTNQQEPRSLCRVRFWPYSYRVPVRPEVKNLYTQLGASWTGNNWDGFVPSYDFYGCCNDPTTNGVVDQNFTLTGATGNEGDFRFTDLICQPFKQARDATRQFLERIDFARGDRVAFVTFDKSAFVIDPDGEDGVPIAQTPCPADEAGNIATGRTELTHMIESECRAVNTLNNYLGVRAEPNSYVWKAEGGWTAFADGLDEDGESKRINYEATTLTVDPLDWDTLGNVATNTYPVRDHCPLQNGSLVAFRSRYSLWDRSQANLNQLGTAGPGLVRIMLPSTTSGPWATASPKLDERHSYELWASCRNTNIGAALRTASSALLDPDTTRRTGTVWVMVLLGDGAAGGSDPARQAGRKLRDGSFSNSNGIYTEPSVYADQGSVKSTWENWGGFTDNVRYGTDDPNRRAEYGAFGVCPFGTPTGRSSLTRVYPANAVARFPFCSDEDPTSRHFSIPPNKVDIIREQVGGTCPVGAATYLPGFRPGAKDVNFNCNPALAPGETVDQWNLDAGNVYDLDLGQWDFYGQKVGTTEFDPLYDVDDYARDWADYIALSQGSTDEQLPTIFTIGFGLNFEIGATGNPNQPGYVPGAASQNVPDFLGEELLRYIADVGDNFQVDTDYQQDWLDNGFRDGSVSVAQYGVRGPCEKQQATAGDIAPLSPRVSCGNYYNAPNQEQLELVFDDIASRMFTRLTG